IRPGIELRRKSTAGSHWTQFRVTARTCGARVFGRNAWRSGSPPARSGSGPNCATLCSARPTSTSMMCSPRCTPKSRPGCRRSVNSCVPNWPGPTEEADMTQIADRPARPEETLTVAEPDAALAAQPLTMVQALNRALHDAMAADDRVLVFGEDVSVAGGVFRVTEGLAETFGEDRCFDTPLAESALIGIAVGLALRGFVPVPEIQFDGFSYPALDQVVSHLAKYHMRTRGEVNMPVTVRIPSFGGIGAAEHHSDSTESYWVHTAGLKVLVPSTPADAYWLLRYAIACPDPVMYLEPKRRYQGRGLVDTGR